MGEENGINQLTNSFKNVNWKRAIIKKMRIKLIEKMYLVGDHHEGTFIGMHMKSLIPVYTNKAKQKCDRKYYYYFAHIAIIYYIMLPVLLDLKVFKIYTFGVFLVLAFFWGAFLLWKNFLLTSYKEEDIFDGLFISLAGGLFIARLVYVILHFDSFGFNVIKFLLINGYPGLSLYGFVFGGFSSFFIYSLVKKVKFLEAVDYVIPASFIALGFGKLGAFLSGAEVGAKTRFLLSLKYVGVDGSRHLTSLYESILFFFATYFSYKFMLSIRRDKYPKGFNLSFFAAYFALLYFLFDPLKVEQVRLAGFSFYMIISASLLLTFAIYFLYYFRSSLFGLFTKISFTKHGKKTGKVIHQKTSS